MEWLKEFKRANTILCNIEARRLEEAVWLARHDIHSISTAVNAYIHKVIMPSPVARIYDIPETREHVKEIEREMHDLIRSPNWKLKIPPDYAIMAVSQSLINGLRAIPPTPFPPVMGTEQYNITFIPAMFVTLWLYAYHIDTKEKSFDMRMQLINECYENISGIGTGCAAGFINRMVQLFNYIIVDIM
jgi:hypothetical protein